MTGIRKAQAEEAVCLTEISFLSKGYWQYPESYLEVWKTELTITTQYIENNDVWVYETRDGLAAYYSIVIYEKDIITSGEILKRGVYLEHMFVHPDFIGISIGSRLYGHMCRYYCGLNIQEIWILADPNASGFYEKMGCEFIKEFPSKIPSRTTPLLKQKLPAGRCQ